MAPGRSQTGVHAWVYVLAALYVIERDPARPPVAGEVLRESLRLSHNAGTYRIDHVKDVLDDLADEHLVECERIGSVVHWRLLELGRRRFRKVAELLRELAEVPDDRDDAYSVR